MTLAEPDHSGGEAEHREERERGLLEARGDTPVVFDFVDETFDAVAELIGRFVVSEGGRAASARRDYSVDLGLGQVSAKVVCVVALVGNQTDESEAFDQGRGLCNLMHLPCREEKPQRVADCIHGNVDLGA